LPLLYTSPVAAAGVAIGCAAVALALWRWRRARGQTSTALALLALPVPYAAGALRQPLAGCVLVVGVATLVLLSTWGDRAQWMPPAVLGLVALTLYVHTLLPGVGEADTFEFQVVVPLLRVAHPTGYPLYILLAKLFTLLPIGNIAWRVSLASAVFATGAALVLYALLTRPSGQWLPAFLTASALAFSHTFWSQAIVAEAYALHNLLVLAILWLLLDQPGPLRASKRALWKSGDLREAFNSRWLALFFLVGLSLTNHLTTTLLLPAVAVGLLWERPRLRMKHWLLAAGLLLLGLSVYLFIPLRWPALNQGEAMTFRQFVNYVSGGQFHGALQLDGWHDPIRWRIVGQILYDPFGWGGLGVAAVGVVSLTISRRRTLVLTGVIFLSFLAYGLVYHVPDISVFLLPAHLILAIWIGTGIAFLIDLIAQQRLTSAVMPDRLSATCYGILIALFALLPLSRIWLNLPAVDRSADRGGEEWGRYVLSLPLAPGSAVLADVKKFAPLYYVQQIEGVRPDIDLILLGSEELYYAELAKRIGTGQTVYLARYLPRLDGFYLRSVGPLVEVRTSPPTDAPHPAVPLNLRFGDALRLLGLDPSSLAGVQGNTSYVTLFWYAEAAPGGDYLVSLRLIDADGHTSWQNDGARPVSGLYPTSAWHTGEIVPDFHRLPIPLYLVPGTYELQVGLFPPFSDEGLPTDPVGGQWATLTTVEITPAAAMPPLPWLTRALLGRALWLTSYDTPAEVIAGAPVAVTFAWHTAQPAPGGSLQVGWVDSGGQVAMTPQAEVLVSGTGAADAHNRTIITAPAEPGTYRLALGWMDEAGMTVASHCDWLAPATDRCLLGAVQVVPAQEGLANYANLVLLVGAEMGRSKAQPGDIIPVTLRWRALRKMEQDYTVFVHLVGPDGQLHGQVDAWPVQGSHPTTRWKPGEELVDPYEVRLDPDAPAGRYRVLVGWYLLSTMQRLRIVDARGGSIGDAFEVGELEVGP